MLRWDRPLLLIDLVAMEPCMGVAGCLLLAEQRPVYMIVLSVPLLWNLYWNFSAVMERWYERTVGINVASNVNNSGGSDLYVNLSHPC